MIWLVVHVTCFCTWTWTLPVKSFTSLFLLFEVSNVSLGLFSLFCYFTVLQVFKYSFLASYLIYNLYTRWVNCRNDTRSRDPTIRLLLLMRRFRWVANEERWIDVVYANSTYFVLLLREVKELNPPEVSDSVLQFASWGAHSQQLVSPLLHERIHTNLFVPDFWP